MTEIFETPPNREGMISRTVNRLLRRTQPAVPDDFLRQARERSAQLTPEQREIERQRALDADASTFK